MKTILKIVAAGIILLVLAIGGCAALIGGAVNEAQKDQDKNGVTAAQFKTVHNGMSEADLRQKFGKPDDRQVTKAKGFNSTCVYYPVAGGDLGDSFQFCFTNGALDSKSKY